MTDSTLSQHQTCVLSSNDQTNRNSTTTSYQTCVTSKTFSTPDAATGPRNQGSSTAALQQNPVSQDRTASTRRPVDLPRRIPYVRNVLASGCISLDQVRRCSQLAKTIRQAGSLLSKARNLHPNISQKCGNNVPVGSLVGGLTNEIVAKRSTDLEPEEDEACEACGHTRRPSWSERKG